jgi:hypothetical protein
MGVRSAGADRPYFTSDRSWSKRNGSWPDDRRPSRRAQPSTTTIDGLDVPADAAAVAGTDRLVVVVGLAGTGDHHLQRAVDDPGR